jgi:hypothetical protein
VVEPAINPKTTTITTTARNFSGTTATFTHANGVEPASAFVATISWGDGKTSTGTITESSNGVYTVTGSHRYKKAGAHTVTTTVTEAGNAPNGNTPASRPPAPGAGVTPLPSSASVVTATPGPQAPTTRLPAPSAAPHSTRPAAPVPGTTPVITPPAIPGGTNTTVTVAPSSPASQPGSTGGRTDTVAAQPPFNLGAQALGLSGPGGKVKPSSAVWGGWQGE